MFIPGLWFLDYSARLGRRWGQRGPGRGRSLGRTGTQVRPRPGGSQFLMAAEQLKTAPCLTCYDPHSVLCLSLLLPFCALPRQGSRECYSQNPPKNTEEQTSSSGGGKMRSPARVSGTKVEGVCQDLYWSKG